jgi:hypothetical protein
MFAILYKIIRKISKLELDLWHKYMYGTCTVFYRVRKQLCVYGHCVDWTRMEYQPPEQIAVEEGRNACISNTAHFGIRVSGNTRVRLQIWNIECLFIWFSFHMDIDMHRYVKIRYYEKLYNYCVINSNYCMELTGA